MKNAVISGSFHQDSIGLQRLFSELQTCGLRILAPYSVNFVNTNQSVVKTHTDEDLSIFELEQLHLRAIREADVLFVHAPGGHVGVSTSFEIGYAVSRHIPVISFVVPADEMLQTFVAVRTSVFDALLKLGFVNEI